jgi:hypothetical protein
MADFRTGTIVLSRVFCYEMLRSLQEMLRGAKIRHGMGR